jgi:N-terminal region of glycosyl transferase group 7
MSLIPHSRKFFSTDRFNSEIPCRILIVEQALGLPFNRGAILNIGFSLLAPQLDYVCFHDVDLLPISADYRLSNAPAMIISHGLGFSLDFVSRSLAPLSCLIVITLRGPTNFQMSIGAGVTRMSTCGNGCSDAI